MSRVHTADPTAAAPLPRGPHGLTREQVAKSQRARLKAAMTELLGENGYAGVKIGELARRAAVSRAAFYEHFDSKEACLLAAYDDFAARLLEAIATAGDASSWDDFLAATLDAYLGELERDPVAARAFLVEMDAAGEDARRRRREAIRGFAAVIAERHARIREREPRLGELPETVYVGLSFGVRELVHERLEAEREPRLTELAPDVITWVTAMVEGAAPAAERAAARAR
jgi:AcrR family transcriptional regulator